MTPDRSRSSISPIETWPVERVDELTNLVLVADPEARLTPDDLLCLWTATRETVVFAVSGAAVAGHIDGELACLTLLVVDPEHRREGLALGLVARFEAWGASRGARGVKVGAPTGRGPWPGIEEGAVGLRDFFGAAGYDVAAEPVAMSHTIPTRFRAEPPPEIKIVRALSEPTIDGVMALVDRNGSADRDPFLLAIEQGTCLVASKQESDACVAALCHSVARTAWIGPLIVDDGQVADLVSALVSTACADLMIAGQTSAQLLDGAAVSAVDLAGAGTQPGSTFSSAAKGF